MNYDYNVVGKCVLADHMNKAYMFKQKMIDELLVGLCPVASIHGVCPLQIEQ